MRSLLDWRAGSAKVCNSVDGSKSKSSTWRMVLMGADDNVDMSGREGAAAEDDDAMSIVVEELAAGGQETRVRGCRGTWAGVWAFTGLLEVR